MVKKRTIVYIDGFNLYYGLLRFTSYKWLDIVAFAKSLLPHPEEHEIVAVKYFTARVNYNPQEPTAQVRQSVYLEGVGGVPSRVEDCRGLLQTVQGAFPVCKGTLQVLR